MEKEKEDKEGWIERGGNSARERRTCPLTGFSGWKRRMHRMVYEAQNGRGTRMEGEQEWKGNKNVQLKLIMEEEEEYLPAGRLIRMEKEDAQNGIRRGGTEWKRRKLSMEEEVSDHWLGTQDKRSWRRKRTALKICFG